MPRPRHVLLAVLTLLGVVALTLAPQVIVGPARADVMHWVNAVDLPLIGNAGYPRTERVLNTLLFLPLGAAAARLLPARLWAFAIVVCAGVSLGVESVQAFVPGRVPDPADVLWNTVGGSMGALVVGLPRTALALRRRQRVSAAAARGPEVRPRVEG
jgi:glycopeptide antibiotics resistance protein